MNGTKGTVLVTGGAGYIGSHTCKALARAGWVPVTYDNLCRGSRDLVKWGPFEPGDIGDSERLTAVISRWMPVAALHFAGYGYVGESVEYPERYYGNNVVNGISMLDTMCAAGLGRIIFSSSCAVYGIAGDGLPITEDAQPRPINPYGESKRIIERVLADYQRAKGLNWVALRYFNAAGADPDGETGEIHDPEPHVIPRAILAALGRLPYLEVLGTDYPTSDGSAVRDYVHVSDIADVHVAALTYLMEGGEPRAFNIGGARGYSVFDIVRSVERVSGLTVPLRLGERRIGDPPILVANPGRAAEILNFRPTYADFDQMIGHAWRWFSTRSRAH